MTQLFLSPLTKFTSDNITALPGARLYFYQNNSSTPKAVYADKNKVTSLGVYVEADSAGIFEPIWLDGTYRATLKYSTNWTTDPVGVVQTGWPIDDVGDSSNFTAFAAWDSTFTYDLTTNTFVTGPDGKYYKSIQNPNLNKNPTTENDYWEEIFILTVFNADHPDGYSIGDIVKYGAALYASNINNNTNTPPHASWDSLTFGSGYVSGQFTPTVSGTSTAGAATYTERAGSYVRVGDVMHIQISLAWSAHTGTGNIQISGLPEPTQASTYGYAAFSVIYSGLMVGSGLQLGASFETDNSTTIRLYACDPAGGAIASVAMDTSVTRLVISGTYFANP